MSEFIQIGFTRKSHGVAGEIKVAIDELFEEIFLEADRVFLEVRGRKMPYFLEHVRGGGELIAKFEDVKTREDAVLIQSKPIFLPAAEVPANLEAEAEGLEFEFVTGFALIDKTLGRVGEITEVIEMPQQEMAALNYQGREVLIPLHESLIERIDEAKKEVHVDLPEGLLDL